MTDTFVSLGIVAVVAFTTFVTRALPFWLFRNHANIPRPVDYLRGVLPFSMMGLLVVYCLKTVNITAFPFGLPELIAVCAVVFLHRWKHSTFLSVGLGTILYMLLVQFVFV